MVVWLTAFGLGAAVGAVLTLLLRRRAARRTPSTLRDAADVPQQLVTGVAVPRELVAAWVQFLRSEVADAANAINNRLAALKSRARMVAEQRLSAAQADHLAQVDLEIERAGAITAGLLRRVDSFAHDTVPAPFERLRSDAVRPAEILVVEDDSANREVICHLLERAGHRVTPAQDGLEAFAALEERQYDCIISDMRMPGLGGKGLFDQVEQQMPNLASRFVFVTGDFTRPETRAFLDTTGCPVIPKPYEVASLLAGVAAALERGGVIFRD